MPCTCTTIIGLSFAISEASLFALVCMIFIIKNCRVKMPKSNYVVSISSLIAFMLHAYSIVNIYQYPNHCKRMSEVESIVSFVPQAIFFMVFIWIIFKLLFVWRSLLVDSERRLKAERILLVLVMRIYCLLWFILWVTQRYLEMLIINEKSQTNT